MGDLNTREQVQQGLLGRKNQDSGVRDQRSRVDWVDSVRGIGILLVVVGHTLRGATNAGILARTVTLQFVDDWIYSFHMPLFFFLAGLFAERSFQKGLRFFLSDKLRTIVYPYFLWSIFQTVVQVLLSRFTNNAVSWSSLLRIVYSPIMQFWFFYALFVCYLLYASLRLLGLNRWGILLVALTLALVQFKFGLGPWGVLNRVGEEFIYFALGVVAANKLVGVRTRLLQISTPVAMMAAVVGYALIGVGLDQSFQGLLPRLVYALSGMVATVCLGQFIATSRYFDVMRMWGVASLAIFVAHTICSAGFRIVLQKFAGTNDPIVHTAGGIIVGIHAPLLLFLVVKRIGFRYLFTWPSDR